MEVFEAIARQKRGEILRQAGVERLERAAEEEERSADARDASRN
jgi:hypothetical protein